MKLKKQFEKLVQKYIDELIEISGKDDDGEYKYYLDFFVSDEIGGLTCFNNELFMNFDDIRFCVDNKIGLQDFWEYQNEMVEEHFKKPEKDRYADYAKDKYLNSSLKNFKSWLKLRETREKK